MKEMLQLCCNRNTFIMASVKIFLYKHKTLKDGTHPIVLQLIKDRKRKLVTIGTSFEKYWNFGKEQPNANHPQVKELRALIRKKKNDAEKAIIELDDFGKPYDVDDVIEKLDLSRRSTSFKEYTDTIIERLKRAEKYGNARIYTDAKSAFLSFNNERDIDLKNITVRKLKQFENHLIEKGLRTNSISVYLRTIRAIYNKAIKENLVSDKYYPFKNFKIKKEATIKRALSKENIKAIAEIDLSDRKELEMARDIFLFSFYNRGMNFIDISFLTNKDVSNERLQYRRRKTKQTFSIKITEQAREIIEKYMSGEDDDYLFPIVKKGNEYVSYRTGIRLLNKRLQKIGKELKLNIPLTSYVARHTWATLAKRSGISTAIISEGLGHDSELTTQIYLDSFENETLDHANEIVTAI